MPPWSIKGMYSVYLFFNNGSPIPRKLGGQLNCLVENINWHFNWVLLVLCDTLHYGSMSIEQKLLNNENLSKPTEQIVN